MPNFISSRKGQRFKRRSIGWKIIIMFLFFLFFKKSIETYLRIFHVPPLLNFCIDFFVDMLKNILHLWLWQILLSLFYFHLKRNYFFDSRLHAHVRKYFHTLKFTLQTTRIYLCVLFYNFLNCLIHCIW